jgi:DNA-binding NarL/FixJ family response regulator
MRKKVLDVGNCVPDHSAIKQFLTKHFDCEVLQAHKADDAVATLREHEVHLVVVNRKLDIDYSDGVEVIRQIKADEKLSDVPVMLITNYSDHQDAAEAIGAVRGFGKLEYGRPETLERLKPILG